MKLPPRVVLTDAQPHRLDHVCIVFDSDCTWSVRALTLKSRAFCAGEAGFSRRWFAEDRAQIGHAEGEGGSGDGARPCRLQDSTGFGPRLKTEPGLARRMNRSIDGRWRGVPGDSPRNWCRRAPSRIPDRP
jgi:hypothetical protein